jgi:hypothetical protein
MEDMVLCWLWERYLALQRFCCHEDGLFSEEETERGTQEGDTGLLEEGLVGYGCCLAVIGLGERDIARPALYCDCFCTVQSKFEGYI